MTYKYLITEQDAIHAAEEIRNYVSSVTNPILGLDTETFSRFGFSPRPIRRPDGTYEGEIALLQIGLDPRKLDIQYIFDNKILGNEFLGSLFKGWLEDVLILGQNLKYDWPFMYTQLGVCLKKFRDTMLISQVVTCGDEFVSHSLPGLFDHFFGNELYNWFIDETGMDYKAYFDYKNKLQTSGWGEALTEEQLKYAASDVRLIFYLYEAQKKYILDNFKSSEDLNKIIKLECSLIPVYAMKELRGIKFDAENHRNHVIPYLESLLKEYADEVAKYFSRTVQRKETVPFVQKTGRVVQRTVAIYDEVECINLNSWLQIKEALRPYCGEDWYNHKGGTDENTLVHYVESHQAIPYIMKYKKVAKALNTYGYNLVEPLVKDGVPQILRKNGKYEDKHFLHEDGKFHPQTYQIGREDDSIATGRSSYSHPNMLAQPSKGELGEYKSSDLMRSSYIAGEGKKWISSDYSNLEARLMAQRTGDPLLIDIFKNDRDLYAITAKEILQLDELPDSDSTERRVGKQTFLSLQYLMGVEKYKNDILKNTGITWTFEKAKEMRQRFLDTYEGIKDAQEKQVKRLEMIFQDHMSLADWAMDKNGRKPIYMERTPMGRIKRWYLTDKQEELARTNPKALHRECQVMQKDGTWGTWGNQFNSYCHQIARESFNLPVQGCVADLVKMTLLEVDSAIKSLHLGTEYGIIIVPHDEINLIVPEDRVDEIAEMVKEIMERTGKNFLTRVPCKAKTGVGANWAIAK